MLQTISLKIIMPSGVVVELPDVKSVTLPGSEGVFQMLPGHMNMVAKLNIGIVVVESVGYSNKYFIYSGISENTGNNANIVTEFAIDLEQSDKQQIQDKITILEEELRAEEKESGPDSIIIPVLLKRIAQYKALLEYY